MLSRCLNYLPAYLLLIHFVSIDRKVTFAVDEAFVESRTFVSEVVVLEWLRFSAPLAQESERRGRKTIFPVRAQLRNRRLFATHKKRGEDEKSTPLLQSSSVLF